MGVQDDFFWSIMPLPFEETEMPTFDASHELDMKRKRHADRGQRQEVRLPHVGHAFILQLPCLARRIGASD